MIRVEAHLCRQIEGDGQTSLSIFQQIMKTAVGFGSRTKARILPHGPELPAVHRRLDTAREWKITGLAYFLQIRFARTIAFFQNDPRIRFKTRLGFRSIVDGGWGHKTLD